MRKLLLISALSFALAGCMESASVAPDSGSSTVTLAPRIVRTSAVPLSLFNGTDRVQVDVYDAASGSLLNRVSADFDARSLRVEGVPANASVRVDIYGLDASSSYLWYGSSSVLAATSAASGLTIDLDISIMPYQANLTPYLGDWVSVNPGDYGGHIGEMTILTHFGDEGSYRWESFFVNLDGDVLYHYMSHGIYEQVGSTLNGLAADARKCDASSSYPASTCNSDNSLQTFNETGWSGVVAVGASGISLASGASSFAFVPLTGDASRYYPIAGTWREVVTGTYSPVSGVTLDGQWLTQVAFSVDGGYVWTGVFEAAETGRVLKHYLEIGTYTRTGESITFTPIEASRCEVGELYPSASCANIEDGVLVTPSDPETWSYSSDAGTMSLTSTGGTTWNFVKQAAALGAGS